MGGGAGWEFGDFFEVVVLLEAGGEIGGRDATVDAPREDEVAGFSVGAGEGSDACEKAEVGAAEEGGGLAGAHGLEGDEAAGVVVGKAENRGSDEDESGVLGVF